MPPASDCGTKRLGPLRLRLRCSSRDMVAEKTKVRMSGRALTRPRFERAVTAELKSLTKPVSPLALRAKADVSKRRS